MDTGTYLASLTGFPAPGRLALITRGETNALKKAEAVVDYCKSRKPSLTELEMRGRIGPAIGARIFTEPIIFGYL